MKKIYCPLLTLLLFSQSIHPMDSISKSKDSSKAGFFIVVVGGLAVGAVAAYRYCKAENKALATRLAATEDALGNLTKRIDPSFNNDSDKHVKPINEQLQELAIGLTSLNKTLNDFREGIVNRVDSLDQTMAEYSGILSQHESRLATLTNPPENDPVRAAYTVLPSNALHLPIASSYSDNDLSGEFGHLFSAQAPQPSTSSSAATPKRPRSGSMPPLHLNPYFTDNQDEESEYTTPMEQPKQANAKSAPSTPTLLSPRDEIKKEVLTGSGVSAGRRNKKN